ncbi:CRISPR-associated endonuclease Cas2 [Yoonia vestfoldensis]|uniref:CRISPR-associated endonuclease Cas2 n=1 Tax=Yoonia vestfoldensis TaxID=245188 RepID=UPI00035EF97B|nr:CRISPR-associated endonuclease Cas2 [Yoonia vestfoldensis]
MQLLNLYIFCYDIAQSRPRRRVAALLSDRAVRVQRSVFEGRLTAAAADSLSLRCAAEIEPGDSLRVYAVTPGGLTACRTYGCTPPVVAGDYLLL